MILDPDEVYRAQRVRMAQFLGITPAQVDALPANDYDDVLAIMWLDQQK